MLKHLNESYDSYVKYHYMDCSFETSVPLPDNYDISELCQSFNGVLKEVDNSMSLLKNSWFTPVDMTHYKTSEQEHQTTCFFMRLYFSNENWDIIKKHSADDDFIYTIINTEFYDIFKNFLNNQLNIYKDNSNFIIDF